MPFVDGRTIPEVLMRPGIHGRFLAHKDLGASTVSLLMNRADFIPAFMPHAWGTEGTEAARMMWVYGGPDPFADSTYLEGEPRKQHA